MESKKIKEPGSTAAGCVHGRLIEDVEVKHHNGKVRCLECGTIFDDPHQHGNSRADNVTEQREVDRAVARAADRLQEKDDAYSVGIGGMPAEEEGFSDALFGRDHSNSY